MPFITVRNLQFYYEIHGSGPPLLLITGTGGDLRRTPAMSENPLTSHYKILSYDQRGLGQTDRPDVPYTMMDYAEDALGLLDALRWERCPVMGISFGGMVAQELALLAPERVERLVLACTSAGGASAVTSYPVTEFWENYVNSSPTERAVNMLPMQDFRRAQKWQDENPEQYERLINRMAVNSGIGLDEPNRKEGLRRQIEARARHNTYDRLPNLKMPVFVCGGRHDVLSPVSNVEEMHKMIPDSRLEFFEGGHLFMNQDPAAFERITLFLQGRLGKD